MSEPASSSHSLAFVVATCPRDYRYARILLASLEYFHPEVPVVVIADAAKAPTEFSRLGNVHRIHTTAELSHAQGWRGEERLDGLLSKLLLFGLDEFERYLFCDADSVLTAPILESITPVLRADFVSLDGKILDPRRDEHRRMLGRYAFDVDGARELDPELPRDRLFFFSSGHFLTRAGLLDGDFIRAHLPHMSRDFSPHRLFRFGDQGFLVYAVNHLAAHGAEVVDWKIVVNGKRDPADYPTVHPDRARPDWKAGEHGQDGPLIVHFTGPSRRRQLKDHHFAWALELFHRRYYRGRRGAELRDLATHHGRALRRHLTARLPGAGRTP